jgi:hypothetical protein
MTGRMVVAAATAVEEGAEEARLMTSHAETVAVMAVLALAIAAAMAMAAAMAAYCGGVHAGGGLHGGE